MLHADNHTKERKSDTWFCFWAIPSSAQGLFLAQESLLVGLGAPEGMYYLFVLSLWPLSVTLEFLLLESHHMWFVCV